MTDAVDLVLGFRLGGAPLAVLIVVPSHHLPAIFSVRRQTHDRLVRVYVICIRADSFAEVVAHRHLGCSVGRLALPLVAGLPQSLQVLSNRCLMKSSNHWIGKKVKTTKMLR